MQIANRICSWGLLQSCKRIQVEPQECRSQQLLLGLITNAGMSLRWCPQLGAVFESFTAQVVGITDSMTGLLKSQTDFMTKGTGACKAHNMYHKIHAPDMSG